MELKEFQRDALKQVQGYLVALAKFRDMSDKVVSVAGPEAALDFPAKAWDEVVKTPYKSRKDGRGGQMPSFCLKIPTGGGKSLLAVKAIDLVCSTYRRKQTGLVLWIVPTNQIYRQTLQSLRDRDHPYRQHLDIASGGRTLVVEKDEKFSPLDLSENLLVLLLMLPSANRQSRETLKIFQDNGGFSEFFPAEDDASGHRALLSQVPNLDAFGKFGGLFGRQIKTSLGNVLRISSPTIILDEGHKAYSETAQQTLAGFNPTLVVELSATPSDGSNILVDIKGRALEREQMIKLDLHVLNKAASDWKGALLSATERRNALEAEARKFEAQSGQHIRPICLVQVERTGKEQRGGRFIHAEDAKEYLIKNCGILPEWVAIKSSQSDDIEGLNLLDKDCQVRYIITKQALQEGWDCSFAYVLAILSNPGSRNGLTQLVGRILRQPGARKTGVKALDESYVYCYRQSAVGLLEAIKKGFSEEGLGDLHGRVSVGGDDDGRPAERSIAIRSKFKKFSGQIRLPVFVVRDGEAWRKVGYESDVLSRVDWDMADFSPIEKLRLERGGKRDTDLIVGLSDDEKQVISQRDVVRLDGGALQLDATFISRQLTDVIPNPWVSHEIAKRIFAALIKARGLSIVAQNAVYIVESIRTRAEEERNRLARKVFEEAVRSGQMKFIMVRGEAGFSIPSKITTRRAIHLLNREDGTPLEQSLFEFVVEDAFNDFEKEAAWYFDEQKKLLWWYRNMSREDYGIQGWQRHRIYPDFIVSEAAPKGSDYTRIVAVETKGAHLKNDDTDYKKAVFAICNEQSEAKSWDDKGKSFPDKRVQFELVFDSEWRPRLDEILGVGKVIPSKVKGRKSTSAS